MSKQQEFNAAVSARDLPRVKQLLSENPDIDINDSSIALQDPQMPSQGTAVHLAIATHNVELLETLLAYHPDLTILDTALHLNAMQFCTSMMFDAKGKLETDLTAIFVMLVKAGANLDDDLLKSEIIRDLFDEGLKAKKSKLSDSTVKPFSYQFMNVEEQTAWDAQREAQYNEDLQKIQYEHSAGKLWCKPIALITTKYPNLLKEIIPTQAVIPTQGVQDILKTKQLISEAKNPDQQKLENLENGLALLTKAPALQNLFASITLLKAHGEALQKDPLSVSHGEKACAVAEELEEQCTNLMDAIFDRDVKAIQALETAMNATFDKAYDDMGNHRSIWPLLCTIALSLTVVGAIALGIKHLIDGRGYGFFTKRQELDMDAQAALRDLKSTQGFTPVKPEAEEENVEESAEPQDRQQPAFN